MMLRIVRGLERFVEDRMALAELTRYDSYGEAVVDDKFLLIELEIDKEEFYHGDW